MESKPLKLELAFESRGYVWFTIHILCQLLKKIGDCWNGQLHSLKRHHSFKALSFVIRRPLFLHFVADIIEASLYNADLRSFSDPPCQTSNRALSASPIRLAKG